MSQWFFLDPPNLPVKSFTRLAHDVNVHFGQGVSKTRPREMQLHKSHPFLSLQMLAFWVRKIHQTENIWELLNHCSLTLHSGKWYGSAFNCRSPAQRWNYQFLESQAAHSITTYFSVSFPRTAFSVACSIFNNLKLLVLLVDHHVLRLPGNVSYHVGVISTMRRWSKVTEHNTWSFLAVGHQKTNRLGGAKLGKLNKGNHKLHPATSATYTHISQQQHSGVI